MPSIIATSAFELIVNDGCPDGFTRDEWFLIPPNGTMSAPCDMNLLAFYSVLIIFATVYGVLLVLCLLAASFSKQRAARFNLVLNTFHGAAGFCLVIGPLVRDDVYSTGNPAFWICVSIYLAGILAHSLLMTDAIKRLSLSVAPHHIASGPLFDRFIESSIAQRFALSVAGVQVVALFVAFILVGYTHSPPDTPEVRWNDDPNPLARREFWFFVGCMLSLTTSLTFIVIPLRLHIRLHRYVKETRVKAEAMLALPGKQQSRASLVESTRLAAVADFPDAEAAEVEDATGSQRKSRRGSRDSRASHDDETEASPRPRRPSRVEQSLRTIAKAGEILVENLQLPPPKRKATMSEVQRKQMQEFENKMMRAFVIGICGCVGAVVLITLICDTRIVGPRYVFVFLQLSSSSSSLLLLC